MTPRQICLGKIDESLSRDPPDRHRAIAALDQYLREQHGIQVVNDESPLSDLDLDLRVQTLLEDRGIRHVGGLRRQTRESLRSIRWLGNGAVQNIEDRLAANGMALAGLKVEKCFDSEE